MTARTRRRVPARAAEPVADLQVTPMTLGRPVPAERRSARDRLLAAADELFYAEGVQTVGIDRVIEHAGVAKASLYNTFGSKEQLVRAYLLSRHDGTVQRLTAAIAAHRDPRARLLAVFDAQAELLRTADFRGCAFVSASAEAAAGSVVEQATDEFRSWVRTLFTDLSTAAGAADPQQLGRQLNLLYDGAALAVAMDHDPSIATATRAAAVALLDEACRPARSGLA